jgi:hypothetical protein
MDLVDLLEVDSCIPVAGAIDYLLPFIVTEDYLRETSSLIHSGNCNCVIFDLGLRKLVSIAAFLKVFFTEINLMLNIYDLFLTPDRFLNRRF